MSAVADLVISPLTAGRWDDVVALFGTRGDPSWCWCQFFLTAGQDYSQSASSNKAAFRSQLTETGDLPPGLLAYAGDEAVGWLQLGPRTAYPRLTGSRALAKVSGADIADADVWAVTCFVVKVGHRRHGVGAALLAAAVSFAAEHGARVLEGHPVDVDARTGKVGGAELYHGVASTFAAFGFTEVGRTAAARPVMRLTL